MQGAKIIGPQDRQFGSGDKGKRLGPKCLDPWGEEEEYWGKNNEAGATQKLGF